MEWPPLCADLSGDTGAVQRFCGRRMGNAAFYCPGANGAIVFAKKPRLLHLSGHESLALLIVLKALWSSINAAQGRLNIKAVLTRDCHQMGGKQRAAQAWFLSMDC